MGGTRGPRAGSNRPKVSCTPGKGGEGPAAPRCWWLWAGSGGGNGKDLPFPRRWLSGLARGCPAQEVWGGWVLQTAGAWTSPVPRQGASGEAFGAGTPGADAPPHYPTGHFRSMQRKPHRGGDASLSRVWRERRKRPRGLASGIPSQSPSFIVTAAQVLLAAVTQES